MGPYRPAPSPRPKHLDAAIYFGVDTVNLACNMCVGWCHLMPCQILLFTPFLQGAHLICLLLSWPGSWSRGPNSLLEPPVHTRSPAITYAFDRHFWAIKLARGFFKDLYLKGAENEITSLQSKCPKKREVRGLEAGRSLSKVLSRRGES